MRPLCRSGIVAALTACLTGCAIYSATPSAVVTSRKPAMIAADRVKDAVVIGRSTRADVLAALGETLVISFENGHELWLYRLAADARAKSRVRSGAPGESAELVILFGPSGVVTKSRIRPAPSAREQARGAALSPALVAAAVSDVSAEHGQDA